MMSMNAAIEKKDKINILCRTGVKVIRGCFKKLFLKEKVYRYPMENTFAVGKMLNLKISLKSMAYVLTV